MGILSKDKAKSSIQANIDMLEKTISEMKERGANDASIKMVEDEIQLLRNDKERVENDSPSLVNIGDDFNVEKNELPYTPILSDLFLVKFKDIPQYLVKSFQRFPCRTIDITFVEAVEFNVYEHLEDIKASNDTDYDIVIETLDKNMNVVRREVFSGISIDSVGTSQRTYGNSSPVTTRATITYNTHKSEKIT